MTPKTRKAVLSKIHVAKAQLGLDDATYRELLRNLFRGRDRERDKKWQAGKPSAADLRDYELLQLVHHFQSRGFEPTTPQRAGKEPPSQRTGKEGYLAKIGALLAEAGRPWAYAHGVARHMFGVDQVQWCDEEQLRKIVAALSIDARRHKRPEVNHGW